MSNVHTVKEIKQVSTRDLDEDGGKITVTKSVKTTKYEECSKTSGNFGFLGLMGSGLPLGACGGGENESYLKEETIHDEDYERVREEKRSTNEGNLKLTANVAVGFQGTPAALSKTVSHEKSFSRQTEEHTEGEKKHEENRTKAARTKAAAHWQNLGRGNKLGSS